MVGRLEKSVSRQQFKTSLIRDAAVNAFIDLTIEQVYI